MTTATLPGSSACCTAAPAARPTPVWPATSHSTDRSPSRPVTTRPGPRRLLAEVAAAGLTGRGGGGFPAAAKWEALRRAGRRPVVVVNAMEGEPASAKDRALLAWSPHLVLDGAELVAALSGARSVVVCVADDRDASARAVRLAADERSAAGAVREVTVRRPPARYVTGEESALVHWLDAGDARPVLRVDKSVPLRLGRRPVLIHNAETLAQVALIARHGAAWFRGAGIADAPGTTLVTVSGAVRTPGVVEVGLGTPVDEVVGRCGPTGPMAGYLVGGYGGAWLAPELASTPLAPAPLARVGATLGVGIVVALPADSCGIAETARIARWMAGRERGPVRTLRLRAPGHRRGPRTPGRRPRRRPVPSAGSTSGPGRSSGAGRAVIRTAWPAWCGARSTCSPRMPRPMPPADRAPDGTRRAC